MTAGLAREGPPPGERKADGPDGLLLYACGIEGESREWDVR
jgi:hypothetical protein